MHVVRSTVRTDDGWMLPLARGIDPDRAPGRPVLFVPGFGMNSHIFRFHPRGRSFMAHLLDHGLDPWSVDLRGQSTTTAPGKRAAIRLADHAFSDLPAAIDHIAQVTGFDRVSAIGCSLGGTLLYAYAGRGPHRLDRLVTMGTPLTWTETSAVVRSFARLGPVLGRMPKLRGTRGMARVGLPLASRVARRPLGVYLNPELTHTGPAWQLSRTVEDPEPRVQAALAAWIRDGHMRLDGHDVTAGLRSFDRPLLVVAGHADRICPPSAALAALDHATGPKRSLIVGSDAERVAHADLFIADLAPERIFPPVARFLQPDMTHS